MLLDNSASGIGLLLFKLLQRRSLWHWPPALQVTSAAQEAAAEGDQLAAALLPQHFATAAVGHLALLQAGGDADPLVAALQLLRRRRRALAAAASPGSAAPSVRFLLVTRPTRCICTIANNRKCRLRSHH